MKLMIKDIGMTNNLFGDLYEWKNIQYPYDNIKSLRISDDALFNNDELSMIFETMNLTQLFLHNLPNLLYLPWNIMKLHSLKVLSIIQCNSLTRLPLSIKYLTNLETLHLDCDNIEYLPLFIALLPSLKLLLLRRSEPMCTHCKQYPKNCLSILIPNINDNCIINKVELLSHLSSASYLSQYYTNQSIYEQFSINTLRYNLENVISDDNNRCIICLRKFQQLIMLEIRFTRFRNCKCIHLKGYLCSESCRDKLCSQIENLYPTANICNTLEWFAVEPLINYQFSEQNISKRFQCWIKLLFSCMPVYRKRTYTISGNT